jgi:hypothetical protein
VCGSNQVLAISGLIDLTPELSRRSLLESQWRFEAGSTICKRCAIDRAHQASSTRLPRAPQLDGSTVLTTPVVALTAVDPTATPTSTAVTATDTPAPTTVPATATTAHPPARAGAMQANRIAAIPFAIRTKSMLLSFSWRLVSLDSPSANLLAWPPCFQSCCVNSTRKPPEV